MKIGKHGYPKRLIESDNAAFFRTTEAGRLVFCVKDWSYLTPKGTPVWHSKRSGRKSTNFDELGKYCYADNSGSFSVDVFVFKTADEDRIAPALDAVTQANPADSELSTHLSKIVESMRLFGSATESLGSTEATSTHVHRGESGPTRQKMEAVVQIGHLDEVFSGAISADGRYLLSGSLDTTMKLWEISTGREIRTFKGHPESVNSVAFSPDGQFALSGSGKAVRLWDVFTGRSIRTFAGHPDTVKSVSFSPDGRLVLVGCGLTVKLWDISTGQDVKTYTKRKYKRPEMYSPVSFSPDGRHIASSGGWDYTVRLRNISSHFGHVTFHGHSGLVTSVAFSSNGRFLLSGSMDRTVRLWDISTGNEMRTFKGHTGPVNCVAFSPDGQFALSGGEDGTLKIWDISITDGGKTIEGHNEAVRFVAFAPDGRLMVSGSEDKVIKLWDVSTTREVRTLKGQASVDLKISLGKFFSLSGSGDKLLKQWEVSTGRKIRTFTGTSEAKVAYSRDGRYALSGGENTVKVWDLFTGRNLSAFTGHSHSIEALAISPDNRLALSSESWNKSIKLWDLPTGREVKTFHGHHQPINSVTFSPDGRLALSGSSDNTIKLWEVATGRNITTFSGHSHFVNSVAFSADGRFALSGGWDNTIRLWEVASGSEIRAFEGHSDTVNSVAFSADGRFALSGASDDTLKLWDVSTGREIQTFMGHADSVYFVGFSPDGRFAVSESRDSTTRIWDTDSGKEIAKLISSPDGEWIIVTPDGYYHNSLEGTQLIHWVFSEETGDETFSFEQFESRFKRPDIIKARLSGNLEAGVPAPSMTRPPHIEMADHLAIKETSARNYSLKLSASALEEVKSVRVFVNGKPTLETPVNAKEKELFVDVPLFAGGNRITAVAYDEKGFSSNPKYLDVNCKHAGLAKPNLYIFAIGISDYPRLSSRWQLEFAHTDANALIEALKSQEGKLFGEVRYNLLSNEMATVDTITEVLDALSAVDANDVVVIFMAGHGVRAKDGTFYFLTAAGDFQEPQNGGVSWTLLGEYLSRIKGRVILLLDACHSGSVVTETVVPNDELAQEFFTGGHGGVMVFSASKGRQFSMESPDIGGGFGIFTYGLVQSLGPRAKVVDTNSNGFVEFMELVNSVSTYVNEETKGEQTPWLSRKELFGDLPIAVVN
ncbi:MAG: caspase family protein [Syntrophobacterales bacterium]|jgi:WD40 repeat protein